MLGSFLEVLVAVDDVGRAMQFYRELGFQELPTGDFVPTPYAAMWDGNIVVGLVEDESEPVLRFVRPKLQQYLPALRRQRIELESTELGDDQFNKVTFRDNNGQRVELVEARTHSLALRDPAAIAACGQYLELSLPAPSVDETLAFWSKLGLRVESEANQPYRRVRLVGEGCSLGIHQAPITAGLSFVAPGFAGRTDFLRARGLKLAGTAVPDCGNGKAVRVVDSAGIALYLHPGRG